MVISIIIFIFTLLVLVLIHELGHFLLARKFNIKVLEFGFGIPPRAWGKKMGETLVSINWLPFGGFVRLFGEDEVDKKILENHRSFAVQKVWKRIIVVVSGVLMNLILAWLLFYPVLAESSFKVQFPLLLNHQFIGSQQNETIILVRDVAKDSPAQLAGIKTGDIISAVEGEQVKTSQELVEKTKNLAGQEIILTLIDPDSKATHTVKLTSRKDPPEGQGPLGVQLAMVSLANIEYQGASKVLVGPIHSLNIVVYSGKILGHLINQSIKSGSFEPVSQTVAGPVGVTAAVSDILQGAKNPYLTYLNFMAILSLNLAVFNVLPIPALDGGRLFFLVIEAVTRKRVHAGVERWIHSIGLALLLTLMLLITFSDIRKLFS